MMDNQKNLAAASTRVGLGLPEVKPKVITNTKLIRHKDCNSRLIRRLIKLLADIANKLAII